MIPEAVAGTSTSTLSVVTSTRASPSATKSPTRLRHSTMEPSVTDSPISGSVTLTIVSNMYNSSACALRPLLRGGATYHSSSGLRGNLRPNPATPLSEADDVRDGETAPRNGNPQNRAQRERTKAGSPHAPDVGAKTDSRQRDDHDEKCDAV